MMHIRRKVLFSLALVSLFTPAIALAQAPGATTTTGVVGGAVTGAIVGGPVGAVVGGVIGGTMGAAVEPPAEVRTYVMQERAPSVRVTENIAVGQALPTTIQARPVPQYPEYHYAVVNDRRVIVEPKTRQVLKIYE
jgi:uncharacterized membrane protein